ncbi:MAG: class I SAM-dependent methyltransferase [bacterium]|nr:class I SAM-dependent methyltransferase [bacterium]
MIKDGNDTYFGLASRYDRMKGRNVSREAFFKALFTRHNTKSVLDCACGTGSDLLLFHSFGLDVAGSDLSGAMLAQAAEKIREMGFEISTQQLDFRFIPENYSRKFDAVVCLTNAINELLDDAEAVKALISMKSVLYEDGYLVVDQGQTDASMENPPRFNTVINDPDYTCFFVMNYSADIMDMNIFHFFHTDDKQEVLHDTMKIKIRLQDDWARLFDEAGFKKVDFYGDWGFVPYDKRSSKRLIAAAFT